MPSRSRQTDRIVRRAALKLAGCIVIIFGFTCIMMQSTVWNRPVVRTREPFYDTLPGVDAGGVPPAKWAAILKDLNVRRCPCECLRTVASCRHHHDTCPFSLAIAQQAVAAAR
jgi:hypothetical protein